MLGKDLASNSTKDVSNCVIIHSMDIQLESLKRNVGIQQAVENTRNDNSKVQNTFLTMLASKKAALTTK
jgi:hypothetical protein